MLTLFTRPGVVGNFIGQEASRGRHVLGNLVERKCCVLIGHDEFAARMQRRVGRIRLDRQLIKRDVVACEIKCFSEFIAPRV